MISEYSEHFWDFLDSIGLGNPLSRGIMFSALFALPIIVTKAKISYFETNDGFSLPKKWSLFASSDDSQDTLTMFPWFIWPIFGFIFGALVL